ncbi:MAG: autotransporter-associated beta strand repeat-containing protein [Planctomycetes bacterium]|nr:autotransporter-associated beta strand repeat-containing protein [Planctomycetota bacterium]
MNFSIRLSNLLFVLVSAVAVIFGAAPAQGATQYSTGTFTWDNGAINSVWSAVSGGPYNSVWTSGNDAVFEGGAGTVSVHLFGATAHNINFNTTGYLIQSSTLTLNGATPTITAGGGISATISSQVSGSSGLKVAGGGTVTLSHATNNYTGATTISNGSTLKFASLPTGTVNDNDSSFVEYTGTGSVGTYNLTANAVYNVRVSNAAGNMTVTRANFNYNNLNKYGPGTLTIAAFGGGSDSGDVTAHEGTLILASNGVNAGVDWASVASVTDVKPGATVKLGNSNAANVYYQFQFNMSGGIFDVNGQNPTLNKFYSLPAMNGSGTITNNAVGAGTALVNTQNGSKTFSGNIVDGVGTVAVNLFFANNTWTLSGNNTYSGATTVTSGTLKAGSITAFSPNSAYSVVGGKTLDLGGFSNSIGSLTGAGNVTLGAATLTVGNDNTSPAAFSGAMTGSGGSIIKKGNGTFTLSGGANNYTGATTISAGILKLTGSGSIANSTSMKIGAGAEYDVTAITSGTYPMLPHQPFTFDLNPAGAGSAGLLDATGKILDINFGNVVFNPLGALNDPFYVLANYGSLSGTQFLSGTAPSGYSIDYNYLGGKQIALVADPAPAVPEPSTFVLAALGLAGLGSVALHKKYRRA